MFRILGAMVGALTLRATFRGLDIVEAKLLGPKSNFGGFGSLVGGSKSQVISFWSQVSSSRSHIGGLSSFGIQGTGF